MVDSTTWYLARLRNMGKREIAHRVIEKAKKFVWRRNLRGWDNFSVIGDGQLTALTSIQNGLAKAPSVLGLGTLKARVQQARDGNFEFLGCRWRNNLKSLHDGVPTKEFWLLDPITGKAWPGMDDYCFDVGFRNDVASHGDVKYIWELNRLQFLHPVAADLAATGDVDLTRWTFRTIASWMAANPPYRGINWASGIELSLRLVSFALLLAAVSPPDMEPDERIMMRRLIAAHGYWLYRYPSLYSSANNHLIAEGLGLFIAGLLAPDLPDSEAWRKVGRNIIEAETQKQILEDGVGAEQSPTYQAFTMEMIAFAALLANSIGEPLSAGTLDRLVKGADHLDWLLDSSGYAPAIGDNDEGRTIALPPDREPRYVASIVAAVGGLTERVKSPPRDPHLRDALFSSPTDQRKAHEGIRIFPTGGYSVVHDRINGRTVDLVFDHGPLGYLSLAAHGHADALAIWLTVGGIPVFIDSGTYLYHTGGLMRSWLRETRAHNTLVLMDQSQSSITGPFMWGAKAKGRLIASKLNPNWLIRGEHDGYVVRFGATHSRCVERNGDEISIYDRLIGTDLALPVSIQFLCNPALTIATRQNSVNISYEGKTVLELAPPVGFRATTVTGDEKRGLAWHSPVFGTLIPAPLIMFQGSLARQEVVTRITVPRIDPL